ncbi:hypothetical protein PHMEG_00013838 [Phytophthora megakarya]|uniref:Coilin N-terminal domain-containing protein n=1 Tax=Phytophthora megakarya TaxID=4795 RepID=A0A225W6X4_9STRA|nr:hypothetical protein PHMEG_00013838 [Phytophthora megakarya]
MEVRVRLVFAEDVGRHVQRRRGFSSCWYLVPKDAKLVGDLAHALLQEFGLRRRCPKGLELRLEELPVLATQSIRIVRDNDTIVVQCPPADESDRETSSSESDRETRHKRKLRRKEQPKKKAKTVKEVKKTQKDNRNNVVKNAAKTIAEGKFGLQF